MITIDSENKSVIITNSNGDFVKIDGTEFQLVDGGIELVNLPSFYDVVVYGVLEENHIPKPIVVEPEIVFEEEIIIEDEIVEPIPEPEL